MVAEDLLKDLNTQQRQVAKTIDGPLLVLAGAGTGKTRCIIYRAAYLIASGKVQLGNLLIVTFTNKAARELRQRLLETFNLNTENIWVGTFHSLFGRILRFEARYLPVDSNFLIYDEKDKKNLMRKIYKILNIDTKKFIPRIVRSIISRQKNSLILPDNFWEFNEQNLYTETVHKIYKYYQEQLIKRNALDFDDILVYTAVLMDKNPEIRKKWQKRFRYIMIDEYQDTNYAQFKIINFLAGMHQNLCVVGDDDQAIYTWRGANIANILNFEKDFNDVVTIRLEQNYRSHRNILSLANSLIKHNSSRHKKELFTEKDSDKMPKLIMFDNETSEALYVAKEIKKIHKNWQWKDSAVLYRTNAQSRILEAIFVLEKIPYRIYGGTNFFQRQEIKDVLAYLRLMVNPADSESLLRLLKLQKGIGKTTIEKLLNAAENKNTAPFEIIRQNDLEFLNTRARKMMTKFRELMIALNDTAENNSVQNTISAALNLSEMGNTYAIDGSRKKKNFELKDPVLISKQENLLELLAFARSFSEDFKELNQREPLLSEYLNSATLMTDLDTADKDEDSVRLMTMHNAKGLEFEFVFITGLEDGLLPHARSLEEDEQKMDSQKLEEERRLLYVGITRAKQDLVMTLARMRQSPLGNDLTIPSRFIREFNSSFLNEDLFDRLANSRVVSTKKKKRKKTVIMESEKHYRIGQKIKHVKFGYGVILNVDGQGTDARLTIKFDNGDLKKIVGSYVDII